MLNNKPRIVTLTNIKQFFDFKSTTAGSLRLGMIANFSYRSPDGVHDTKPFVYVLENLNGKITGLNLHYDYRIVKFLIEQKDNEVANFLKNSPEYKKQLDLLSKPDTADLSKTDTVPSVETIKDNSNKRDEKPEEKVDLKKIRIPNQLLESYEYKEKADSLIRTYLFLRMSSVYRMSYRYF